MLFSERKNLSLDSVGGVCPESGLPGRTHTGPDRLLASILLSALCYDHSAEVQCSLLLVLSEHDAKN